jgi:hypothetical protein
MRFPVHTVACAIALTAASGESRADIIEFTDKAEWEAAAGQFTTIDFTGFDSGTIITTQYVDLGVVFTDGDDTIVPSDAFINDGWGLAGGEGMHMAFTAPMTAIAADYPGALMMDLYRQGDLIFTSSEFGGGGTGWFAGVVSSEPFDFVVFRDWIDQAVAIDDLYFGPPIPGAPAFVPFVLAAMTRRRRRT